MNKQFLIIAFVLAYQSSIVAMEESSSATRYADHHMLDYNLFKSVQKIQDIVRKLVREKKLNLSIEDRPSSYERTEKGLIFKIARFELTFFTPWGTLCLRNPYLEKNGSSDDSVKSFAIIVPEILKYFKTEFKSKDRDEETYSIREVNGNDITPAKMCERRTIIRAEIASMWWKELEKRFHEEEKRRNSGITEDDEPHEKYKRELTERLMKAFIAGIMPRK